MAANISSQLAASVQRYFEDRHSAVKQISRELNGILGYEYPLRVDWAIIREAIAPNVLADDAIVPRLSDCLTMFLRALLTLLQSDTNNFRSNFLSATSARYIQVLVHPHANGAMPFTRLNTSVHALELYLPRHRVGYASNLPFGDDLEECVNTGASSLDPTNSVGPVPTSGHEHAAQDPRRGTSLPQSRTHQPAQYGHQYPTAAALPSPLHLLTKSPIYIRITESDDIKRCVVRGYKPVVDLLADYLNRHSFERSTAIAGNNSEKSEAHQAGCATVTCYGQNLSMALASILEGSLGFERLMAQPRGDKISGLEWLFRRDGPGDAS